MTADLDELDALPNDEKFIELASAEFLADLWRPRDEFDVGLQPGTLRAAALELMDEAGRVLEAIEAAVADLPWYHRVIFRVVWKATILWARFARWASSFR